MNRHRNIKQRQKFSVQPDIHQLDDVVSPKILKAMRTASARLVQSGIPHALAGALAIGVHGYPRATKDVDFLVGEEAFQHHSGGIVTLSPGVPISVGDVPVDPISIAEDELHLNKAVDEALVLESIPVLPIGALVYLKLKSPRRKDSADLVELVKSGSPIAEIRKYLVQNAPHFLEKFDKIVADAEKEEEDE